MSNFPEWIGAFGTWIAAVGTVAAVSVALRESRRDRKETLKREHISHAACVSAWPSAVNSFRDPVGVGIQLINASNEPVYEVVAFPVFIQAAAPRTGEEWMRAAMESNSGYPQSVVALGALLPGEWEVMAPQVDTGIVGTPRLGAEIAFTDRFGTHWIRRSTGSLEEVSTNAISYYDIPRPLDYTVPVRHGKRSS